MSRCSARPERERESQCRGSIGRGHVGTRENTSSLENNCSAAQHRPIVSADGDEWDGRTTAGTYVAVAEEHRPTPNEGNVGGERDEGEDVEDGDPELYAAEGPEVAEAADLRSRGPHKRPPPDTTLSGRGTHVGEALEGKRDAPRDDERDQVQAQTDGRHRQLDEEQKHRRYQFDEVTHCVSASCSCEKKHSAPFFYGGKKEKIKRDEHYTSAAIATEG